MKKIQGIYLPDHDEYFTRVLAKSPEWEPAKIEAALSYCTNHRVAIDVGAHVGLYTTVIAAKFCDVYAIEADKANFDCLLRNVEALNNVTPYNVAAGPNNGFALVHYDSTRPGNTGSHFISPNIVLNQPIAAHQVPMVTIDSLHLQDVDLIKIDVEGFEQQVILGAFDTLTRYKPVLLLEQKNFANRYSLPPVQTCLDELGYQCVKSIRSDYIYVGR